MAEFDAKKNAQLAEKAKAMAESCGMVGLSLYSRTEEMLPPTNTLLSVVHRIKGGFYTGATAFWTGAEWIRTDGEIVPPNYYYLWRKLRT